MPNDLGVGGDLFKGKPMRAAFYERPGRAREVLTIGDQSTPEPGSGEVRVALRLPLERIAEAHEAVEQGTAIGKVLLEIG